MSITIGIVYLCGSMRELLFKVRRDISKIKSSKDYLLIFCPNMSRGYSGDCSKESEVFHSLFLLSVLIIKNTGNCHLAANLK